MNGYWYVDDSFLLARTNQKGIYGFNPDAMGDGLFFGSMLAMATGNELILLKNIQLLKQCKRWPDKYNVGNETHIAKNRIDDLFHPHKYRSQNSMTRDPYIMTLVAMHQMGCIYKDKIGDIKIRPWWINRPDLHYWHRYLETGKDKYRHKYENWATTNLCLFGDHYPMYALHLEAWKAHIAGSAIVSKHLQPLIPEWNFLCKMLVYDPCIWSETFKKRVNNYVPKFKYQWTQEYWVTPTLYDTDENWNDCGYYIDDYKWIEGNILGKEQLIRLDELMLQYAKRIIYK